LDCEQSEFPRPEFVVTLVYHEMLHLVAPPRGIPIIIATVGGGPPSVFSAGHRQSFL
jgi:hypothetical protein